MGKTVKEQLLAKMRQPVHISYLAKYVANDSLYNTQEIIFELMSEGLVEESEYAKKYYVVKNQKK